MIKSDWIFGAAIISVIFTCLLSVAYHEYGYSADEPPPTEEPARKNTWTVAVEVGRTCHNHIWYTVLSNNTLIKYVDFSSKSMKVWSCDRNGDTITTKGIRRGLNDSTLYDLRP